MTGFRGQYQLNAISFDLEHWHSATLVQDSVNEPVDYIDESLEIVLNLLDRHDVRATFFVVGEVALEYPALIERISSAGHELASHGHTHTPLHDLSPSSFQRELARSREAIVSSSGSEPIGFRAPNFSITRETQWAIEVLEASDYTYDSSVFPLRTPLYGVEGAPVYPYSVQSAFPFQTSTVGDAGGSLVEFPLAVFESVVRFPIAGGFYARVLPTSFLERGIHRLNDRGIPANLYFHPWEFNPAVETDAVPVHKRFVSFHGIERLERKLERLLESFSFAPLSTVLAKQGLDIGPSESDVQSTEIAGTTVER